MRFCLAAAACLTPAAGWAQVAAPVRSPSEIVAAIPSSDWAAIAPDDLIVMDLAAGPAGKARRVVIQLMPAPFSTPWVANIRKLAAARWWDGLSVYRVQDNYVAQWGDADGDDAARARALPDDLVPTSETGYQLRAPATVAALIDHHRRARITASTAGLVAAVEGPPSSLAGLRRTAVGALDPYGPLTGFVAGWPMATDMDTAVWPVHCYAMVGVARDLSPNAGTGAELYTVIGHAPRHLDRNIALVGRVIAGIEHLSSLPRGTGMLGIYQSAAERTAITAVRLGGQVADLPTYEYLSTDSPGFASYADARANRRDPFFIQPAGGADICNVPVPVRQTSSPDRNSP